MSKKWITAITAFVRDLECVMYGASAVLLIDHDYSNGIGAAFVGLALHFLRFAIADSLSNP